MTRSEVLTLMCEAALLPDGTLDGSEALSAVRGWDSLAGVDFQRLVDERWHVELDGMKVTEAKTVAALMDLLGDKLED